MSADRLKAILGLLAALLGVLTLSISLPGMVLAPGVPLPQESGSVYLDQPAAIPQPEIESNLPLAGGIAALVLLLILLSVPARFLAQIELRKVIWISLAICIILVIAAVLPEPPLGQIPPDPADPLPEFTPVSPEGPVLPLGEPPRYLLWLICLGLVAALSLVAGKTIKDWLLPAKISDQILEQAETAARGLRDGADPDNVIIRFYIQMSRVLLEERGVERQQAMTTREFEQWLQAAGYPAQPVQQLSHLFERTRYGGQPIGKEDLQAARSSLQAIIYFCRSEGLASHE